QEREPCQSGRDHEPGGGLPGLLHRYLAARPELPPAPGLCPLRRRRGRAGAVQTACGPVPTGTADRAASPNGPPSGGTRARGRGVRQERAADLRLARRRLLFGGTAERVADSERLGRPNRPRVSRRGPGSFGAGRADRARDRPGRRGVWGRLLTFARPVLLLTLLVIPLAVCVYLLTERRHMRYAIRFTNVDLLAGVVAGRIWRRHVPLGLFLLALAALCVGVARPQHTTLVPKDRATVILVLDVSRSMESQDVKPSRIGAATASVRTFLDRVPKRLQVGLIAFAGDPAVATPPTTNHALVREALDTIQYFPSYGGTAIGDALAAAVTLGQQAVNGVNGNLAAVTSAPAAQARGLVSILFLSDGAQTRGTLQPLEGAERARAAGIPVYTVALGTPNGTLDFGFGRPPPNGSINPSPFGGPPRR